MRNSVSSRSYNCCRCSIRGKTSKISVIFFYNNADEIGQKIINCQNIVAPFHISIIADIIHRYIFLLRKKISGFEITFFFSFHLRCGKNWYLWGFSPYPVTTTIIWPTTDGIPHSLVFKSMQIKRIADNIRAFFSFFFFTNWNKESDEEKIYHWTGSISQ